jgi:hypothetical protein
MRKAGGISDRAQHKLLFETGVEGLRKYLGPFSSFRRLFGAIAVGYYVVGFLIGEYVRAVSGNPESLRYFLWGTPGLVSNILVVFFVPRIVNAALKMTKNVSPYTTGIDMQSLLLGFFRSPSQILFPTVFALGAALFQIKYLVITPWEEWLRWYMVSPSVTLVYAIVVTLATAFSYFLIGLLFYLCAAGGYLVYKTGKSLRQDLGPSEAESPNMQWPGRFSLVVATAWMASVGVILLQALVAPIVWWSTLQLLLFAISSIAIFFLPITSSYESLRRIKSRALDDIRAKIWARYPQAVDSSSEVEARLALSQIRALRLFEERIAKGHNWPLTGRMLVEFLVTFVAFNLPHIKTILETLNGIRI